MRGVVAALGRLGLCVRGDVLLFKERLHAAVEQVAEADRRLQTPTAGCLSPAFDDRLLGDICLHRSNVDRARHTQGRNGGPAFQRGLPVRVGKLRPHHVGSAENMQGAAAAQVAQNHDEVTPIEPDASLGRQYLSAIRRPPHQVEKDRASHPPPSRSVIVAEHHDHVIEVIVTPEPFRACRIGMAHRAIVVAVARIIAPPVFWAEAHWRANGWSISEANTPLWPNIDPANRPAPDWRCTIAFPLQYLSPAATERAWHGYRTKPGPTTSRAPPGTTNDKVTSHASSRALSPRAVRLPIR